MDVYRIIYLWQGERYWGPDYPTLLEAKAKLAEFQSNNWQCWIEHYRAGVNLSNDDTPYGT